ncbi:MAG TPA: divergent polysaccharide deacetylase family protein [Candidatus Cloacimonadota bacterium]|jgi:hypothetical protein|nr:divergent polysaccharide deacetylase family protein [Candidatus Cloacimonadota bacterium]
MARKKTSPKGKSGKSKNAWAFPLIALAIVSILFYYIVFHVSNSKQEVEIHPIKKSKKIAQKAKPVKQDTVYAEMADNQTQQETIPEEPAEEAIETPKPVLTEKGKYYTVDSKLPKICIIVDDFGYIEGKLLNDFLSLDKEIAFSILPGLKHSVSTMKKAVQNGNEVLIHAPLEPESYPKDNPGDNAILVKMDDQSIKKQMNDYIKELNLAIGVNHHMGSKAAADTRVMNAVMSKVKENGLFYIDSYTNDKSVVESTAKSFNVAFAKRRQFLDVPESSKNRAIQKVEEIKKMKGNLIVVITHCHNDVKLRQLKFFIERLKDNHYQIIPPSKAVRIKETLL